MLIVAAILVTMSGGNGREMAMDESRAVGEARESWCAVERQKEESWCRKTRRHHKDQYTSTVFDKHVPVTEPRCTFEVNEPTHKERRHFPAKCKSGVFAPIPFFLQKLNNLGFNVKSMVLRGVKRMVI